MVNVRCKADPERVAIYRRGTVPDDLLGQRWRKHGWQKMHVADPFVIIITGFLD